MHSHSFKSVITTLWTPLRNTGWKQHRGLWLQNSLAWLSR